MADLDDIDRARAIATLRSMAAEIRSVNENDVERKAALLCAIRELEAGLPGHEDDD
jgi:hypothetical protein